MFFGNTRLAEWVKTAKDAMVVPVCAITPLVLHHKSFTKTCHEHHVYMLMHVIECVDQFL